MPVHEDRKMPDLVSVTQAADMLGVTRQRMLQLIAEGIISAKKVGSTWVLRRILVEKLAAVFADERQRRAS